MNNHSAKFEYKGMKTFGVTHYTNLKSVAYGQTDGMEPLDPLFAKAMQVIKGDIISKHIHNFVIFIHELELQTDQFNPSHTKPGYTLFGKYDIVIYLDILFIVNNLGSMRCR